MSNRIQLTPQLRVLAAFVVTVVACLISYALLLRPGEGDLIIRADPTSMEIAVEIRGEVGSPGLYRLPEGSRLGDLIDAAGGTKPAADLSTVNLAQRLNDGGQIVIPPRGAPTVAPEVAASPADAPSSISYRVNINRASQPELESLPGIGPVLAERIIEHRTTNGPFTTVDQLTEVDGISASLVEEIRSLVTAGP